MTRARRKLNLPPRGVTDAESADHIGLGPTEYKQKLLQLEAEGFPKPDPLTRRRDIKAIDCWMDARSGLAEDDSANGALAVAGTDPLMEALNDREA